MIVLLFLLINNSKFMGQFNQDAIFNLIKEKISPHQSLVQEVSEILDVSMDSAYRRLRGQTPLSFEEAVILARHFSLSIDNIIHDVKDSFPFVYRGITYNVPNLETYYRGILEEFKKAGTPKNTKIYYSTKDIPMFHIFAFPKVAAFRLFFWKKTIYDIPEFKNATFDLEKELNEPIIQLGRQVLMNYIKFPSYEIWSSEVVNSTVNPILYYYESGVISKVSEAKLLLDEIDKFVDHIRKQAEYGTKFLPEIEEPKVMNNFELYYNEVTLSNNTIILESEGKRHAYLVQNAVDFLRTDNADFCERTMAWMNNITRKSVMISSHAEKFRQKFFTNIHREVERARNKIE